ncbi:NAD(P)-dependent oxidoreductase [Trujillonella humicola]|uniref:NAD(P)-dependent oxidoreductase n=1 Tax=Trujillonella humicola TaxID=3383699 RepID=UPI0039060A66
MELGFIGAGRIGRPMIGRLVAAGHRVRVLDRSEAAREAVSALGATPVDDVAAVASGARAVLLCPYSDTQVREIALDGDLVEHMEPGTVLVIHTTGSPLTATGIAVRAAARDVEVVDAPISGGPPHIEAGAVTLYTGATEAGLERARPVLSAYGDPIVHLGPTGAGQQVKLINNAVFAANIGIIAEAVRLAGELGLDEGAVLRGITNGSGNSMALGGAAHAGSIAAFGRAVGEFVGKDVAVVKQVAAALGVDLGEMTGPHRVLADLLLPEHRALLLADASA